MTWTTEVPTEAGYYWFRKYGELGFPVEVEFEADEPYIWWFGTDDCEAVKRNVEHWTGEWYGPIQPPE